VIKSLVGFRKSETEVKDLVLNVSSIQLETFGMHGSVAESFFLEIRRKLLQFYLNIEISTSLVTKLLQQASSEPVWSSPSSNSLDHPGHMGGSRGAIAPIAVVQLSRLSFPRFLRERYVYLITVCWVATS